MGCVPCIPFPQPRAWPGGRWCWLSLKIGLSFMHGAPGLASVPLRLSFLTCGVDAILCAQVAVRTNPVSRGRRGLLEQGPRILQVTPSFLGRGRG